jgi:hypothetical protein
VRDVRDAATNDVDTQRLSRRRSVCLPDAINRKPTENFQVQFPQKKCP